MKQSGMPGSSVDRETSESDYFKTTKANGAEPAPGE